MSDVLKMLDDMQEKFYSEFGDIHKSEMTQHEKHLTWMSSKYADLKGLEPSTEEDKPYFSQKYNNFTFIIGYRIGRKEMSEDYQRGYDDAVQELKWKMKDFLDGSESVKGGF